MNSNDAIKEIFGKVESPKKLIRSFINRFKEGNKYGWNPLPNDVSYELLKNELATLSLNIAGLNDDIKLLYKYIETAHESRES